MKIILVFSLICFTLSVWGPYDKIKNSNSEDYCNPLTAEPTSLSECVDLNLYVGERYYDRCCFVRYQYDGQQGNMCFPLKEEHYSDITESIKRFEKEYKTVFAPADVDNEGKQVKVYQFDCSASNIKYLFIASILLAFLF